LTVGMTEPLVVGGLHNETAGTAAQVAPQVTAATLATEATAVDAASLAVRAHLVLFREAPR
jgi:hypothetical protein